MIPDQIYLWGWAQWVALATLSAQFVLAGVAIGREPSGTSVSDKSQARVAYALLWTAVLASGGFWS